MSSITVIDQAQGRPTGQERAGSGGERPRRRRRDWGGHEVAALGIVASAVVGFACYGVATGAPGTVAYVFSVGAVTAVVVRLRSAPVPPALALALAFLAVAHLAGGLIEVGDGVLYNAQFASEVFRYYHLVHSSAVFVGTLVVFALFAGRVTLRPGPASVVLWVLAGLGLGAVNETVEFLTTMVHDGSQVGGYTNTGWDLVSNVVGTVAAGLYLAKTRRRSRLHARNSAMWRRSGSGACPRRSIALTAGGRTRRDELAGIPAASSPVQLGSARPPRSSPTSHGTWRGRRAWIRPHLLGRDPQTRPRVTLTTDDSPGRLACVRGRRHLVGLEGGRAAGDHVSARQV